jgi:hypothetical protein
MFLKSLSTTATISAAIFSLAIFYAEPLWAWNFSGHAVIAQIAYDNLTPPTKQKADQLALLIFQQLSVNQQEKLKRQYPTASTFAQLAIMPDVWRQWRVGRLLQTFHATLPINFLLYGNQSTANWHFITRPYPATSNCNSIKPQNIVWAIQSLESDLHHQKNDDTEAMLMVLEEHYMGDIHEPLHTLTKMTATCTGDKGGNDFCLKLNKKGRCVKNLHQLWDSAVGYLKPHTNIAQTAWALEQRYQKIQFSTQLNDNNPHDWAKANYQYANFIYGLQEYQKPNAAYYREGQDIATEQMALAGYRLANALNSALS